MVINGNLMQWKGLEYLAYLEGQIHIISQLLKAEAISIGVLEVDGNRLGDCSEIFENKIVDYLSELDRDYFYHMDHVYSNPSYIIIVIATTQDKINEARRVFRLTDPDIYRIKLDQLLGCESLCQRLF